MTETSSGLDSDKAHAEQGSPAPAPSPGFWLAPLTITTLGAALRFFQLDGQSLWLDEAISWRFASAESFSALLAEVRTDVHPPLYFALLRGWIGFFGDSEWALRSLSALLGTSAIPALNQRRSASTRSRLWLAPSEQLYQPAPSSSTMATTAPRMAFLQTRLRSS